MIKDINELLDRIPIWRKLQDMPKRMEALEAKVAELEGRLENRVAYAPGEECPWCGALAMRLHKAGRRLGSDTEAYRFDIMGCTACSQTIERKHMV